MKVEELRPARKGDVFIRVHKHNAKVGNIFMPNFCYNAEHNAAKQFRFQTAEVLADAGEFKKGDIIMFTRWNSRPVSEDISVIKSKLILVKVEECGE